MVYTNKEFAPDETFPPPPMFMTWIDVADNGKGRLRHHESLVAARKYVDQYTKYGRFTEQVAEGTFTKDWAIHEWCDGDYAKLHEGKRGDFKANHPLFKPKRRTKEQKELDAAIASVLSGR